MATDGATTEELCPTRYLEKVEESKLNNSHTALVILNSPIDDYEYFKRLYDHSSFVLCADGAANRLHDLLLKTCPGESWEKLLGSTLPNTIHGDLDSLDDTVRERYHSLGVEISLDTDQYSTDFTKAIKKTVEALPEVRDIIVIGSIGGRVDHGIGLLASLYREQKSRYPGLRLWLFSETSISTILHPGTSVVRTPVAQGLITQNAGILPVYGKASITLTGFEWDVQDWPTEMGGQMSTSNHIVAGKVSVATDVDVLFTVERRIAR